MVKCYSVLFMWCSHQSLLESRRNNGCFNSSLISRASKNSPSKPPSLSTFEYQRPDHAVSIHAILTSLTAHASIPTTMLSRLPIHLSYSPLTTPLSRRTLSTTFACLADIGSHRVEALIPQNAQIPEYPYGPSHIYKQSNKGLYGGSRIQFGNNVSNRTEIKTRRSWSPNIISKSLYSVALRKKVKIRVSSRVLRTIDKVGGLDEYILGEKEARIKELGPQGWKLRWRIMSQQAVKERFRVQAAELGLSAQTIQKRWGEKKKDVETSKATNSARKKSKSNADKMAQNRFGALKEGSRSKISGKRGIGINKRQETVPREETKIATEG